MAFVLIGESAGISAASLISLPGFSSAEEHNLFSYPEIKDRFSVTTDPEYLRNILVICGIATRSDRAGKTAEFIRPLHPTKEIRGHAHAAVFPFKPLVREEPDLQMVLQYVMNDAEVLDVVHLLYDDRESEPVRESSFFNGSYWFSPLQEKEREVVR